jgi:hypothetical protein
VISDIRASAAVFVDETSWYVGAPGSWLRTFTTADSTVYHIDSSRGRQVVLEMLGPSFNGILVSDCLASCDVGRGRFEGFEEVYVVSAIKFVIIVHSTIARHIDIMPSELRDGWRYWAR